MVFSDDDETASDSTDAGETDNASSNNDEGKNLPMGEDEDDSSGGTDGSEMNDSDMTSGPAINCQLGDSTLEGPLDFCNMFGSLDFIGLLDESWEPQGFPCDVPMTRGAGIVRFDLPSPTEPCVKKMSKDVSGGLTGRYVNVDFEKIFKSIETSATMGFA